MHALAALQLVATLVTGDVGAAALGTRGAMTDGDGRVPRIAAMSPGVELPNVANTGLDHARDVTPAIAVSPTALTVRGHTVAALVDGTLDGADVAGGAAGTQIPALVAAARALEPGPVALQVDRRIPFRTLVQVLASLHAAGHPQALLLARAGAEVMSAPVALAPELTSDVMLAASPGASLEVQVTIAAVRLVLDTGITREELVTLTVARGIDLRDLTAALAELRARYGASTGQAIVVRVDGGMPVQAVVDVIGAVRATAEGAPLYPDVVLAVGVH